MQRGEEGLFISRQAISHDPFLEELVNFVCESFDNGYRQWCRSRVRTLLINDNLVVFYIIVKNISNENSLFSIVVDWLDDGLKTVKQNNYRDPNN